METATRCHVRWMPRPSQIAFSGKLNDSDRNLLAGRLVHGKNSSRTERGAGERRNGPPSRGKNQLAIRPLGADRTPFGHGAVDRFFAMMSVAGGSGDGIGLCLSSVFVEQRERSPVGEVKVARYCSFAVVH